LEAAGAVQRDLRKLCGTRHADLRICRNQLRFRLLNIGATFKQGLFCCFLTWQAPPSVSSSPC